MANKYYRQNLRNGTNLTKRKSNIAKIMETFGPKKKDKKEKPKKRMFASMGGGADSGRMGEIKSKLAVAGMKAKDVMGKSTGGLTKKQIERLKEVMKNFKGAVSDKEFNFIKSVSPKNMKKGGRAALKKGTKFPDHSGDGKITQKDILMAKGVIPKTKSKKKII
tara:strand:- start:441 stop:932 length:492 start_codon:yes stop_codon:yes gene_type:complete